MFDFLSLKTKALNIESLPVATSLFACSSFKFYSSLPCFLSDSPTENNKKKIHIFMAVEAPHIDLFSSQLIADPHR